MFGVGVCELCLACNVRMFRIENSQLHEIYKKITNTEINISANTSVCYICFSHLLRSQRLSELALKSQMRLKNLVNTGVEISLNTILKLNLSIKHNLSISNQQSISIVPNVEYTKVTVKKELLEIEKEHIDDDEMKYDNLCKHSQSVQTPLANHVKNSEQKQTEGTLVMSHKLKVKKTNSCKKRLASSAKKPMVSVTKASETMTESQLITQTNTCIVRGNKEVIDTANTKSDSLRMAKIKETLLDLENLIAKSKSEIVAKYNLQCQYIKECNKKSETVVKRLPKRRYPWCNRSRALLASLVDLAESEEEGAALLKYRAKPLFPTGFARMPALLKMAGCKWPCTIKPEMKPQDYGFPPKSPPEFHTQMEVPDSVKESPKENIMLPLPYILNTFSLKANTTPIIESKELRKSLRLLAKEASEVP